MDYQKILQELTLTGLRVFVYCLKNMHWHSTGYTQWYGMEYKKGQNDWKRGMENLIENGYIERDGEKYRWTIKARERVNPSKSSKK